MPLIPANSSAVWRWLAAAGTVFANGALAGARPRSLTVGGGTGAVATGAGASLAMALLTAAAAFVSSALFSGWEAVHAWHEKNQIPNPFLGAEAPTPIPAVPVTDPAELYRKVESPSAPR